MRGACVRWLQVQEASFSHKPSAKPDKGGAEGKPKGKVRGAVEGSANARAGVMEGSANDRVEGIRVAPPSTLDVALGPSCR